MARVFEISLNGTGIANQPAERALLSIQATSTQLPTPAAASTAATKAANLIREMLLPHCPDESNKEAGISHYSMSTLDTSTHTQRDRTTGQPMTPLFSARAEFSIKFLDFALLNTLATKFSAMDNVIIKGITWALTDATLDAIKGGVRKQAAQDAIVKANDYAEVFAGDKKANVRPVSMSENNYYSQSTRPHLHHGKGSRGMVAGREELHFEPEDVRLEITVSVKFVVEL